MDAPPSRRQGDAITISNPSVRAGPFVPTGGAIALPFDFLALSAGELSVTQVQADGSEVAISGWSALLNGEGGNVLFPAGSAPALGSGNLYVNAAPNLVQNLAGNAPLLPGAIAAAFDRVTQIALLALARSSLTYLTPDARAALAAAGVLFADQGTGT